MGRASERHARALFKSLVSDGACSLVYIEFAANLSVFGAGVKSSLHLSKGSNLPRTNFLPTLTASTVGAH